MNGCLAWKLQSAALGASGTTGTSPRRGSLMPPTKGHPAICCPTCGGIRNVTNLQCARCYMREYRKRIKKQEVSGTRLEQELREKFGHPLAWPRILSLSGPIREHRPPRTLHNTCSKSGTRSCSESAKPCTILSLADYTLSPASSKHLRSTKEMSFSQDKSGHDISGIAPQSRKKAA